MGLREIFILALGSGVTTAISIKTGIDTSEIGFAFMIINALSKYANPQTQEYFLMVSIVLGILSVILFIIFIIQVLYYGKLGIITAILGFVSPLVLLLSPTSNTLLILMAILMIIAGGAIAKLDPEERR